MLEQPALTSEQLTSCLRTSYGLSPVALQFLPLGADPDTAVYRLTTASNVDYFVKLRSGSFDSVTVAIPSLLAGQGNAHVIAPLLTVENSLYTRCEAFAVVLYPYIEGRNGFAVELTLAQWAVLGSALRTLHALELPVDLAQRIARETYSPGWRKQVRSLLAGLAAVQAGIWPWLATDAVAHAVAELLHGGRARTTALVERAETLAAVVAAKALPFVLCHADIHAGNVLITDESRLYVVDWDTLKLAPKEHDLMFVGAGIGGWQRAEQAASFYGGYGPCTVDPDALAYYRCERVVQDLAVYCQELLLSAAGGADRAEGLHQLASQFEQGSVVDIALATSQSKLPYRKRSSHA